MTALDDFGLQAAKRFLQSVVFVDDEIYDTASGRPGEISVPLEPFKPPFYSKDNPTRATPSDGDAPAPAAPSSYHPRQLVESFAVAGIVCALYEPQEGFKNDAASELFKLCDRTDIVILDWDLYKADGQNILPLIRNLAGLAQSSVPHHVRLCIIYTTKPDLERVASQIYDALLKDNSLSKVEVVDKFTVVTGATRIVVLGKPDVVSRPADAKTQEVKEEDLANRTIHEFAKMTVGMLPSYALNAMAEIRRNTKRVIDKFDRSMDAPFYVNRALVIDQEEAFNQLPELLAEELLSIIQDSPMPPATIDALAKEFAETTTLDTQKLTWATKQERPEPRATGEALARRFLVGGKPAVKEDLSSKDLNENLKKHTENLHTALGCDALHSQKNLASLFTLRTMYGTSSPTLQLGTIVRFKVDETWTYLVCVQPLCDGVRLPSGEDSATEFPFWKLKPNGNSGPGFVIRVPEDGYLDLFADGKPREQLSFESFQAGAGGVVSATREGSVYRFGSRMQWVAQLKPAHAQRIAFDVGQKLSRVGLIEAEWLRQRSGSS